MARFRITRRPDPARIYGPAVYEVEQCYPTFLFWTNIVIATYWCYVASFANIEDAEACVDMILEIEAVRGYVAKEYN
tara:strand:- start:620 stop:850 length:231 start_codon:yes stop_codon:yes gene_type:complete